MVREINVEGDGHCHSDSGGKDWQRRNSAGERTCEMMTHATEIP